MVVSGSTNGTWARIPANRSGARLATAPISSPPALPPNATSSCGRVNPESTKCCATATKSVKVFFFSKQLAVLVPQPAHLAAAADMGDDEHHAAVQQRQPRDGEAWIRA